MGKITNKGGLMLGVRFKGGLALGENVNFMNTSFFHQGKTYILY
jgi:hypothetical protein